MARGEVLLINSNRMRPPVAPLALDYVGDRLKASGYAVRLVDLAFDEETAIDRALADAEPLAVGVTFRNTDDCYCGSGAFFVPALAELVARIKPRTKAPVVLGGCGYSVFPVEILAAAGADFGVVGDGEETFEQLVRGLADGDNVGELAGLVRRADGEAVVNPPVYRAVLDVPPHRSVIDNARYFREGGQGNIETKRGCPSKCIYCADPVAKGRNVRGRPPAQAADEVESLLRQGVDVLHVCDGEFNIPPAHAIAVCEEFIRRGLGERARWYCYATVHPFPPELAELMRRAGCAGINFGVDSGCDRMLALLHRGYKRDAIRQAVRCCREAGLAVMLDLLIGAPGEDEASVRESIEFIRSVDPDRAGAATGVRVYPGTALADRVREQGPMASNPNLRGKVADNDNFLQPVFYLDARLGPEPANLVCDIIGGDKRFFPPPRHRDATDYNYNDNRVLEEAVSRGERGAYWDILRRLADQPRQS
ncbi:MAG TPA: radical SAM protein [Candidatus Hydrogenedentes bacterium]|nr:radical SAM protein [Candidatus Hydrogenedentota bacterium]